MLEELYKKPREAAFEAANIAIFSQGTKIQQRFWIKSGTQKVKHAQEKMNPAKDGGKGNGEFTLREEGEESDLSAKGDGEGT